ncbi:MAG TPA: hypothetical protein VGJ18_10075 [Gemmatimonadaceae bacterium]
MPVDSYYYDANCRHWPDVVGRFPVGTLEFEVTDLLRNSQYAPEPTVTRRLYVRAWYPAGDVVGYPRRPYFTDAEVGTVPVMSLQLLRQPPDALRNAVRLFTNACVGAPPAIGKFPVAVFNHGYLSYPAQHTALFEHLAANGYVVLSVGHPWESGGIVYPNGDAVLGSPRILEDMMQIGQALGAMAAYAAPTSAAQLGALREYIRVLRTTSAGRLAPVWRDDVYLCSTGSRRIRFRPRLRCQRSSITSAGPTWANPLAPTSPECWRRVTRVRAASCTSMAGSGPTS